MNCLELWMIRSDSVKKAMWVLLILGLSVPIGNALVHENGLEEPFSAPEALAQELYRLVTFKAGQMPDWDKVRDLFDEDAVILLRLGPKVLRTFDRQSFIDYFIYDIARAKLLETGFRESILKMDMQAVKDIAFGWAVYEVVVPGRNENKPVNRGIDCFHLVRKDGRWRIASIVNEGFRMSEPLPDFVDLEK